MDIVLRESERLNGTIRSFLAYARPQRPTIVRLDLAQIVHDTARLLRNGSDVRANHVVEVDVPGTPVALDADDNQIRQIVWNLATNGLRAMPDGGTLRLAVEEGAHAVALVVSDEGCGIPAHEIDRIFQPFRSSFDKGTGLGLATVHRIVSDMGGHINVSSTVGVGTSMRVQFPVQGQDAEPVGVPARVAV